MPGIFDGLKRLIMGEPVYKAGDSQDGWVDKDGQPRTDDGSNQVTVPAQKPSATQSNSDGIVKGNPSTFPQVYVRRTRTHLNGSNQDVYCSIYNASRIAVELEEITIAGRSRRLGDRLNAGEEREILAYNGSHQPNEGSREAHLNYKTATTGDYFQSIYDVEYSYQSDKSYTIEELHLRLPIRDIYG